MLLRRTLQSLFQIRVPIKAARNASSLVDLREGSFQTYDTKKDQYQAYNENSPVWACNEWDPLEEVIIGRPDNAVVPYLLPEFKACVPPAKWEFFEKNGGKYFADVVPEHWKKLVAEVDNFVKVVEAEGVKVIRPEVFDHGVEYKTPYFTCKGFYNAMPRDMLMVVGDEIIEAGGPWRQRFFEFYGFKSLCLDYWKRGAKWTSPPKPRCDSELIDENYDTDPSKRRGEFVISESEPVFDPADFVRAGTDIFAQPSQVTNLAGIEWMRRHLAPRGIRVHEVRFRGERPMHIDTTFSLVRPGYAITNPARPLVNPEPFIKAGWKLIEAPQPNVPKDHPMWVSSAWLSMNTLMKDPNAVFVEKNEGPFHKVFEKIGVRVIPVPMYHMNSIGGGFHCWTCDIRRKGKMETYF